MISYYKYYFELKNRLILLLITWCSLLITSYYHKETVLFLLVNPINHLNLLNDEPYYFIFTNVNEMFNVYIKLSFFLANQITILMIFYHTLMFLSLGLYKFEFVTLKLTLKFFIISWTISLLLLYNFLIPISWSFFLSFQHSEASFQSISFFFEAKIIEYLDYFKNLYYICLINCQFFAIVTLLLTNIEEKLKKIKTFRKLFYFIFLVFSTLTTPPDIISQILLSSILILIYELLIFARYLKINMVTS